MIDNQDMFKPYHMTKKGTLKHCHIDKLFLKCTQQKF